MNENLDINYRPLARLHFCQRGKSSVSKCNYVRWACYGNDNDIDMVMYAFFMEFSMTLNSA